MVIVINPNHALANYVEMLAIFWECDRFENNCSELLMCEVDDLSCNEVSNLLF